MKIYIASSYSSGIRSPNALGEDVEEYRMKLAKKYWPKKLNVLESFHYIGLQQRHVKAIRKDKQKIFLDSGAYSMFTQGVGISLEGYANFVKANKKIIKVVSNVDCIGKNKEKQTYENQKILEDYGIKPCPVHHARDNDKWLERYIEEGYDYILLGGMVPESTKYLIKWLDRIWGNILTDSKGKPIVKVHGFGLTVAHLMQRYPWFSVDSSTWAAFAAYGNIMIPSKRQLFKPIAMSDSSPALKVKRRHYHNVSDIERKEIDYWIKFFGFKRKHLTDRIYGRGYFNINVFRYLEQNTKWKKKFHHTHRGLFDV